jgi:hypothetical protein
VCARHDDGEFICVHYTEVQLGTLVAKSEQPRQQRGSGGGSGGNQAARTQPSNKKRPAAASTASQRARGTEAAQPPSKQSRRFEPVQNKISCGLCLQLSLECGIHSTCIFLINVCLLII